MNIFFSLILFSFALAATPECPDGELVPSNITADGCPGPAICRKKDLCPDVPKVKCVGQETIVPMGVNKDGCTVPPKCVVLSQCPKSREPECPHGRVVVPGNDEKGCPKPKICMDPEACAAPIGR